MTYPQLLDWIKAAGFEQWSWVVAVLAATAALLRWLLGARRQELPRSFGQTFNSADGASKVGQQIGGSGHTVIQNNGGDPQLVESLLDRISARDKELRHHEATLKAKDQLLIEKEAEIQQLRRQGVQSVVDAASQPESSSKAKDALSALKRGDIDGAQSLLRALEEQAARQASPHRREAAQLAREQGALWLGTSAENAYVAFERAIQHMPDDLQTLGFLIDISRVCRPLGVTRHWVHQALELSEKLSSDDPSNNDRQRDLSVSYVKTGDLQNADGKRADALKSYKNGMEIRQRLAALDPANARWQLDLWLSLNRVGDLQSVEGKFIEALETHQEGLDIAKKLTQLDASNLESQRALSISYSTMGDLRSVEGKRAEALTFYRNGLEIHKHMAVIDAKNTERQRDLSVCYSKIGDLNNADGNRLGALKSHNDALEIRKRLAMLDSTNTLWQRDLSISYERIGDLQNAEGKRGEALMSHQYRLAIATRLANLDKANILWQCDLSVSHIRIGDLQIANGRHAEASRAYKNGLEIEKNLAQLDRTNIQWQVDVVVTAWKLSGLVPDGLTRQESATQLQEALAILSRLKAAGALRADQQDWSQMIQQRLDGWK